MKAQAREEAVELTASELANDGSRESEIVGYVYDSETGKIRLITIEQYTGAEVLFVNKLTEDDVRKLEALEAKNLRHKKKNSTIKKWFLSVMTSGVVASLVGGALGLAGLIDPVLAISLFGFFPIALVVAVFEGKIYQKLRKDFPVNSPETIEGLPIAWSNRLRKALITDKSLTLGSPSHESLLEAIKLSNHAWTINETIEEKEKREREIHSSYKSNALREEQKNIERDLASLKQEFRDTEDEIQAILLRDEN